MLPYFTSIKEEILSTFFGIPTSYERIKMMNISLERKIGELNRQVTYIQYKEDKLRKELKKYADSLQNKENYDEAYVKKFTLPITQLASTKALYNKCINSYTNLADKLTTVALDHDAINIVKELASISLVQYGNSDAAYRLAEKLEKASINNETLNDIILNELGKEKISEDSNNMEQAILYTYFLPKAPPSYNIKNHTQPSDTNSMLNNKD